MPARISKERLVRNRTQLGRKRHRHSNHLLGGVAVKVNAVATVEPCNGMVDEVLGANQLFPS